jgi:hypothetical protein
MLFVLSLLGYPVDGLTQSTVLAIQEVSRANRAAIATFAVESLIVVSVLCVCAVVDRLAGRRPRVFDTFDVPGGDIMQASRITTDTVSMGGL